MVQAGFFHCVYLSISGCPCAIFWSHCFFRYVNPSSCQCIGHQVHWSLWVTVRSFGDYTHHRAFVSVSLYICPSLCVYVDHTYFCFCVYTSLCL